MSTLVETPSQGEAAVDPRRDRTLSLDELEQIDTLCDEFESEWRRPSGEGRPVEACLTGWQDAARRHVLRELLAIELEYRRKRGETVDLPSLESRFPDDMELVRLVHEENSVPPPEDVPTVLRQHSRYRVVGKIGAGGMGAVFRAEHSVLCRPVAIKVIRPELLARPEARERFLLEARAAASLSHPNIVSIYDAEALPEGPFLVMEQIDGVDLARLVLQRGPLPAAEACDAVRQAALGLQAAFEAGLVHRDLSPRNLIRTDDGVVKLLDFGLAQLFGDAATPNEPLAATIVGSRDFRAPEQETLPPRSDIRSDIYSLGCVLWFLLTGASPHRDRNRNGAQESDPPALPEGLERVLARMLADDPNKRFQAPKDVAEALAPFSAEAVAGVHGRLGAPRQSVGSRSLAIVVLMALLAGSWWTWRVWHHSAVAEEDARTNRLYREALHLIGQRQEKQVRQAVSRLETVLSMRPDDAEAWASLAMAWNLIGDYGWELPEESFPRAIRAGRRAIELDEDLAEAHLALAFAWHAYECDWEKAEDAYKKALELDPELASAHHWYAWYLVQRGQPEQALEEVERAQELAPEDLIIVNNVGKILYYSGQFAEAAEKHRYAISLDPDFRKAHLDLAYDLVELGQSAEALDELEEAAGISEIDTDVAAARAYALARSGQTEDARAELARLEPVAEASGLSMEMVHLHAALGDLDEAFRWLEIAIRRKSSGRAGLNVDPRLVPLRGDARFQKILAALQLNRPVR